VDPVDARDLERFVSESRASLLLLRGEATGLEFVLDQGRCRIGRGPGADLALDEEGLAAVHALVEFSHGAFHLRRAAPDLELRLNGAPVERARLKPDDRFAIAGLEFQFAIARRFSDPVPF
jgi:predicted component of type VI protein secretion system